MAAPLSVVIPTLDAAQDLPVTAGSLFPGLESGLIRDLVISDGGSHDGTRDIAERLGATFVEGPASRGGQLRRGAEAALGDWLLLLHADSRPERDWPAAVLDHMNRVSDRAAFFRLRFRSKGLAPAIVAGWANLRSRALGLPYGDQGLLIGRDLLERIGGVPDVPLMEDVILARRLCGRLVPLGASLSTSAARYERDGWIRRSLVNGWTLTRYLAGVPPDRLVAGYRSGGAR